VVERRHGQNGRAADAIQLERSYITPIITSNLCDPRSGLRCRARVNYTGNLPRAASSTRRKRARAHTRARRICALGRIRKAREGEVEGRGKEAGLSPQCPRDRGGGCSGSGPRSRRRPCGGSRCSRPRRAAPAGAPRRRPRRRRCRPRPAPSSTWTLQRIPSR
jgi:hypothetical protein